MPAINGLTHEEITMLLEAFYPTMLWRLDGTDYDGLTVLPESPVPKPSIDELKSHAVEARQLVVQRRAYQAKVQAFFARFPIDTCIINIVSAITKPETSTFALFKRDPDIIAMRDYWLSL